MTTPATRPFLLMLRAGMESATRAADTTGSEGFADLTHDIAHVLIENFSTHTVLTHLCSDAAVRLNARNMNVTLGEITFRRDAGVWTFDLGQGDDDMHRACQLVAVYANLVDEIRPDGETPYTPTTAVRADAGAWQGLFEAIPEDHTCRIVRCLMVIAGVLAESMAAAR